MARYCPNCSAQLKAPEVECWNCGALFGPSSSWAPTDTPNGVFEPRQRVMAFPKREPSSPPNTETRQRPRAMVAVRVLLQLVLVLMFLLILSGALMQPITAVHIGNMIGGSLFFILLFVATFSIGESKEKQSAHILGYMVNPKTFGVMLVVLGAFMVLASWRVLSGQPLAESQASGRGAGIIELLLQMPALLLAAGLALAWYGVKLFRARQPNSRKHRRPNAA
jgi:hypothetical protein